MKYVAYIRKIILFTKYQGNKRQKEIYVININYARLSFIYVKII